MCNPNLVTRPLNLYILFKITHSYMSRCLSSCLFSQPSLFAVFFTIPLRIFYQNNNNNNNNNKNVNKLKEETNHSVYAML